MTLHTHSEHSFLDGRARCDEIAQAAAALGYDHAAITDHDEVGGHLDHQRACLSAGVKPVFGTEARWVHSVAASREAKTSGRDSSHIVLIAGSVEGLRNLWALSSLAYEPANFYGKPQLEPGLMRSHRDGLWASDGCGLTRFADLVEKGDEDGARREWATLLDIFGDRFYSELHTWQVLEPRNDEERALNARISEMNRAKVRLSREMGVPLVAVNDSHYVHRDQWEEHRLVYELSTQAYRRDQVESKGQAADWFMSREETVHFLGSHGVPASLAGEAVANASWIAGLCDVEVPRTLSMPRLHQSDADEVSAFLREVEAGFKRFVAGRGLDEDVYLDRLERECRLIVDKGMVGYFNVVGDYVRAARDGSYLRWVDPRAKPEPCLCGPGRGSGGGSLVNWVLGITSIDPIRHDLLFERFLNPDRTDFPDIDVDFQKSRRNDVKEYLAARYGAANVCSIGTRSRSGPKQMLKDIARAMGVDYGDTLAMVELLGEVDDLEEHDDEPGVTPPTWDEVLAGLGGKLAPWAKAYPVLFRRLERMVGLVRQASVHAAGVVVNSGPLLGAVPTRVRKGVRATQFDMNEVAALGGVKEDLLANRGLDVLAETRSLVWAGHRVWLDFDGFGYGVPDDAREIVTFREELYDDERIWEQIDRGQTAGVFQLGTPSGTQQAVRFKPRSLVDVADLVAINRPGVIRAGQLENYLKRRRGEEPVRYEHPMMEPITGPSSSMNTYGVLVYQEQLIRAARDIAGFTPGEAEELRKAIGKKVASKLAAVKPRFVSGCMDNPAFVSQGGTRTVALRIWSSLEAAGAYAFNRAHSVGYATQACWEVWTKHRFYNEFITACLSLNPEKADAYVRECRKRGSPVLLPDINESGPRFTLTPNGIRYGLCAVKGIGDSVIPDIVAGRPYGSVADYVSKVNPNKAGKKGVVDVLVKVGAFDSICGGDRQAALDEVYYHRAASEVSPNKWKGLGEDERSAIVGKKWAQKPEDYPSFPFDDENFVHSLETELLGTHVSVDPMARYAHMIEGVCIGHPSEVASYEPGARFVVGGQLVGVRHHLQRNGKPMAFLTVRWAEEDYEVVAFAREWEANKRMLSGVSAPVACEVVKLKGKGCQLSKVERLDWM